MTRQTEGALTVAALYCLTVGISGACILEHPYIEHRPRGESYFANREVWPTAAYMGLGVGTFVTFWGVGTRMSNKRVSAEERVREILEIQHNARQQPAD